MFPLSDWQVLNLVRFRQGLSVFAVKMIVIRSSISENESRGEFPLSFSEAKQNFSVQPDLISRSHRLGNTMIDLKKENPALQ